MEQKKSAIKGERAITILLEKMHSEETQTLRAGCSKAEPKISPAADPLPLPFPTNRVW